MNKLIMDVVPGDIILEGPNRTEVSKVDTSSCMHKVHINDKFCFEDSTVVRVQD